MLYSQNRGQAILFVALYAKGHSMLVLRLYIRAYHFGEQLTLLMIILIKTVQFLINLML